jgi:hypothetical protein
MYTLKFESFIDPENYPVDRIVLYVVRDGSTVLYVGVSKSNVWGRWFGSYGRMQKNFYDEWVARDSIATHIVRNMPMSLSFEVDLWAIAESIDFLGSQSADLDIVENEMIVALLPKFNYIGNSPGRNYEGYKAKEYLQYIQGHQSAIKNKTSRPPVELDSESIPTEDDIPF